RRAAPPSRGGTTGRRAERIAAEGGHVTSARPIVKLSTMYAIDGRRLERTSLDDVTACRSKPRRGPKPLTSHRELAAAALELIDEEGLNALTMRRLAERVGLGTMALYRYFSSKP